MAACTRRTGQRVALTAVVLLCTSPSCFWEGRSGVDAAAFNFFEADTEPVDAGVPVDGGVALGACQGDADQAVLDHPDTDMEAAAETCGMACISEEDFSSCSAACLQTDLGLSAPCATCYADDAACTLENCLPACMDSSSAECQACREATCSAAFDACTEAPDVTDAGPSPDGGDRDATHPEAGDAAEATDVGSAADAVPPDHRDAAGPLDGATGACQGSEDQAVITDPGLDLGAEIAACGAACFRDADVSGCTSSCLSDATGLSAACATCYGEDTACTIDACLTECLDAESAACQSCRDLHCVAALTTCIGVAAPADGGGGHDAHATVDATHTDRADASPARDAALPDRADASDPADDAGATDVTALDGMIPGACQGTDDQTILSDPDTDVDAAVSTCAQGCFTNDDVSACTASCVADDTGLSGGCATCYGDATACTIDNCLTECMAPDSQPCQTCREAHCTEDFEACAEDRIAADAGATDATTGDGDATAGFCQNTNDQILLDSPAIDIDMIYTNCRTRCITSGDVDPCTADCMADDTGISEACTTCFVDDKACVRGHCSWECVMPNTTACLDCRAANCDSSFTTCSGL